MDLSRRNFLDFLKATCAAAALPGFSQEVIGGHHRGRNLPSRSPDPSNNSEAIVNDIHSQLNATRVHRIIRPLTSNDLRATILMARSEGKSIGVAGGRHSMGGQQFGTGTILVDTRGMNRVLNLDSERGIVEVEAGIEWPELLDYLSKAQAGRRQQWGIMQKQTGADRLSLGGALASNVHGRGLKFKPIIDQIESFILMDHRGVSLTCSRHENPELFQLVIGGYGLFGIVTSVRLKLWERRKVQRIVEIRDTRNIIQSFDQRIADGFLYGDFQFATDSKRDSFLRRGVFSCYRPVDEDTPITPNPTRFHPEDWARLTYYSHKYKRRAFEVYTKRYLATSGQIYWSDSQLSAAYVDNYHEELDRKLGARVKATEMITEIYVPRPALAPFMEAARDELRRLDANVIYGTVRLIEKDEESFLRWARESFACVIFNLHVRHDSAGLEQAAIAFRSLIDLGIKYNGSYYLTYHRFASKEQVEACYHQFKKFLELKLQYDPDEVFQSEWYRHYRRLFGLERI
ncbi:MAG TPA: FAD-binding oxidoreductase [Blastocatellia bacterium]|nr:FAD-binding oxidoreductase [Blastocatellia bacterium]